MVVQVVIHVSITIFLLSLRAMAQISDCANTTETICDGNFPVNTEIHTKYECSADLFSSVELPSCQNGNTSTLIFWFWYNDVCRFNNTRSTSFAMVRPNNVTDCTDTPALSITKDSCEKNYNITRRSMIIKNVTNTTTQKYICIHGRSLLQMIYSSAVIYSINISDSTTLETTTSVTTFSTMETSSISTGNFSAIETTTLGPSSKSWILKIVLPSVLGVVAVVTASVIGFIWYKRHHLRQRESAIALKVLK